MTKDFTRILRTSGFAFAVAASLLGSVGASSAEGFTAEQRSACTPDAFRSLRQRNPERFGDHRLHAQKPRKSERDLQGRFPEVKQTLRASLPRV